MDKGRRDLSQFCRLLIHPAFRSAPKERSAPRRQSATISYRNSYRLGYWREKCPNGSAGVPAEATGRAAPTAVGAPETKADDQHLAYPLAPKIFDSSRIRGPLKSADSIQ